MRTPIYDALCQLKEEKRIPFHMPGHKRKVNNMDAFSKICSIDITEITDYDDLHHPEGIIRESMDQLKEIYHTKESWYLINGSTVGILAAISSVCRPGDKILIGRNCHKAVYHSIRLLRLEACYLCPRTSRDYDITLDIGEEERKEIEEILQREKTIRAVVITSPTYEGVMSDVSSLKKVLNRWEIPLIVDEAHGAHFQFHEAFPKSAVECGADLVIQSTHKTLPAFTQTALLHLCSDRVSVKEVNSWLAVYETSSPSYLLMASAEQAVAFMHNERRKVQNYVDNLRSFREKCGQLREITLLDPEMLSCFDYDIGKLVFSVKKTGIDGKELFDQLLKNYHIELEMQNMSYVIGMTSVMDEKTDYDQLFRALQKIDQILQRKREKERESSFEKEDQKEQNIKFHDMLSVPEKQCEVWQCETLKEVSCEEAVGRVAGEYVMLYPPGIPLLVPGEKIIKEMVENIQYYLYNGYNITGLENGRIVVMEEGK